MEKPVAANSANGTLFAINTNGTGFTTLHSFVKGNTNSLGIYTNSDGIYPLGPLTLSGDTLYGAAGGGGSSGHGTVFKMRTDGTGFSVLHEFGPATYNSAWISYLTNSDGITPTGGLVLYGKCLYGTASGGGTSGTGALFKLNTDGTGFTNVYSFEGGAPDSNGTNSIGSIPLASLLLYRNTLYGTANYGGYFGYGTVFSLSLASIDGPQLTIIHSGANVALSWPTNYAGFDYSGYTLESTTNLNPPVWNSNLPASAIVNGQKSVTVPITGTQQFFRLRQ
jgi:uncharacterized repeat protein (TIGR03803 family)